MEGWNQDSLMLLFLLFQSNINILLEQNCQLYCALPGIFLNKELKKRTFIEERALFYYS